MPTPEPEDYEPTRPVGKENKFQGWFVLFSIRNVIRELFFFTFFLQFVFTELTFSGGSECSRVQCRRSENSIQVMMDRSQQSRNETFAASKKIAFSWKCFNDPPSRTATLGEFKHTRKSVNS